MSKRRPDNIQACLLGLVMIGFNCPAGQIEGEPPSLELLEFLAEYAEGDDQLISSLIEDESQRTGDDSDATSRQQQKPWK